MMESYDPDVLQEIASNVNLVDYIGSQMDLEYRSGNYFAHCPMHIDKTPSFSINPEKNFYYCFSCGRGGNIINYLIQYEHLKRDDAIKKAARLADINLDSLCRSKTLIINKQIRKRREKEIAIPHEILPWDIYEKFSREPIPEWEEEGISKSTLDEFNVRIDTEANRIVYPVTDITGNLINVKGRTRFENYKALKIAKYINYFPVGCLDYFQGFDLAKEAIKASGEIKIFESVKSVMKMYDHGIYDCVSAETHYLTKEQVVLILQQRIPQVVLCWDSDVLYTDEKSKEGLNLLKRFTNVSIVEEKNNLLGGPEAKNSPIDCGFETWEYLYQNRRKV